MRHSACEYKLVYILGAGHCGSTLLNLLLNAHPEIIGLSEIKMFGAHVRRKHNSLSSPFWRSVIDVFETATDRKVEDVHTYLPQSYTGPLSITRHCEDVSDYVLLNHAILRSVAEVSGKSILVDSSKSWQRLYFLATSPHHNIYVINLIRDGRAILYAYKRKYGDFQLALSKYVRSSLAARFMRSRIDKGRWIDVQYEGLAMNPELILRSICTFIGTYYTESMLDYRQSEYHGIDGNRMVWEQKGSKIIVDQQWKEGLTRFDVLRFQVLAGWLNKLMGY